MALAAIGALAACSRGDDDVSPVATPQLTVQSEAAIGSPIDMSYRFNVAADAPAFAEDYWVFVHFVDADGELMWTDDHEPPTPVRQWRPGAAIEYTRTMFVPKFPYVGDTRVEVGLFSQTTGDRLPLAAETEGQRSYRVASFNLRLLTDNVSVVFRDGWHETEAAGDGSGFQWQWSRDAATLAFPNPRRDVVFFLQVDQPVAAFEEPQRVELRVGPDVVDVFALPVGPRELRRVALSASQLGAADTVEMMVAVDKTFVPATVPGLGNTDPRQLGIRVFRAFVQPQVRTP